MSSKQQPRPARVRVKSFTVECQNCGTLQPDANGSTVWLASEFARRRDSLGGRSKCFGCGKAFTMPTVVFDTIGEGTKGTST